VKRCPGTSSSADREDKLRQHGVEIEDFEDIVQNPARLERSRSSARWIAFGYDMNGEWTACVYELDDDQTTVFPITAYRPGE
jgi:uncharacterized DUF497 family protein